MMDKRTEQYIDSLDGLELALEYSTLANSEKKMKYAICNRIVMGGFCEDEEDCDKAMIRILANAYRALRDK